MKNVHVVAGIMVRDGRIFCAHRTKSASGPGWEFPGGKVCEGESPEDALRRELTEELDVRLASMWFLDTVEHDLPEFHMSMDCYVCSLLPGSEPTLSEHDDARWLDRNGLLSVDWLEADRNVALMLGTFWDQIFASTHL